MGRHEFPFDSRAAIEELVAAGMPRQQAVAYARLLVRAIRHNLAGDHRHPGKSSDSAGSDIPFDTGAAADDLVAAGIPEPQADALARLLARLTKLELAVTGVIQHPSPSDGAESVGPRVRTNRPDRWACVRDPGAAPSPRASPPVRPCSLSSPFPASWRQ